VTDTRKNSNRHIQVAAGTHRRSDPLRRADWNRRIGATLNDERRAVHLAIVGDRIDREETAFVRGEVLQGLFQLRRELFLPITFGNSRVLENWLLDLIPSDLHTRDAGTGERNESGNGGVCRRDHRGD